MIGYIGYFLITLGVLSIFFSALSLLRFPDFYSRLNCSVKFAAFGIICLMLGVLAFCGFSSIGIKALVCCALVLALLPADSEALICSAGKSGLKTPGETDSQE